MKFCMLQRRFFCVQFSPVLLLYGSSNLSLELKNGALNGLWLIRVHSLNKTLVSDALSIQAPLLVAHRHLTSTESNYILVGSGVSHCTLDMHSHVKLQVSHFGLRAVTSQRSRGVRLGLASRWNGSTCALKAWIDLVCHNSPPNTVLPRHLSFPPPLPLVHISSTVIPHQRHNRQYF